MGLFFKKKDRTKEKLLDLKTVKIKGLKFVIKRVNPFLDFPVDRIPQIFTDFISKRPVDTNRIPTTAEINRIHESMESVIKAGVYSPKFAEPQKGDKAWKEDGLTIRDLFLDDEIGYGLYAEILNHSLIRFKGLTGVFFSKGLKRYLFTQYLKPSGNYQSKFFARMENTAS